MLISSSRLATPLAVLPFDNLSSDSEQEYFADGVTVEVLNALSRIRDLRVTGRTSSFYFKDRSEDPRQIGAALGVAHILEGSVRCARRAIPGGGVATESIGGARARSGVDARCAACPAPDRHR
jgi:TolB-like protein